MRSKCKGFYINYIFLKKMVKYNKSFFMKKKFNYCLGSNGRIFIFKGLNDFLFFVYNGKRYISVKVDILKSGSYLRDYLWTTIRGVEIHKRKSR